MASFSVPDVDARLRSAVPSKTLRFSMARLGDQSTRGALADPSPPTSRSSVAPSVVAVADADPDASPPPPIMSDTAAAHDGDGVGDSDVDVDADADGGAVDTSDSRIKSLSSPNVENIDPVATVVDGVGGRFCRLPRPAPPTNDADPGDNGLSGDGDTAPACCRCCCCSGGGGGCCASLPSPPPSLSLGGSTTVSDGGGDAIPTVASPARLWRPRVQ